MLLHEIEKIENGRCLTGDGALGDLVGEAVSFATEITEKNARGTDSKEEWFEPLGLNDTTKALIRLFSSEKKISDSELHSLADSLNVSPQTLEEEVYSLLQSFFSKGRYMSSDYFVPDENEVKKGDKIEQEHTDSPVIARRITLDHLAEIKDYNTRLTKMEKEAETKDAESIETEDPLTEKGQKILAAMKEHYGTEKGEEVFYRSKNAGTISGVDKASCKDGGVGSGIQGHVTNPRGVPGGFIQENSHAYMSQVGNKFVVWGKKNGGLQKMGESANALEAAHLYWGIRDCKTTGDGGEGSGIKGHLTNYQSNSHPMIQKVFSQIKEMQSELADAEKRKDKGDIDYFKGAIKELEDKLSKVRSQLPSKYGLKRNVSDGGVGSGVKGHLTPEQIVAMKNRIRNKPTTTNSTKLKASYWSGGKTHKGSEKVEAFKKAHPYVKSLSSKFQEEMATKGFTVKYRGENIGEDVVVETPSSIYYSEREDK